MTSSRQGVDRDLVWWFKGKSSLGPNKRRIRREEGELKRYGEGMRKRSGWGEREGTCGRKGSSSREMHAGSVNDDF